MRKPNFALAAGFAALAVIAGCKGAPARLATGPDLRLPAETRLANLRQLTQGGENAEAYFSNDDRELVFQSTRPPHRCDQIFVMPADGSEEPKLVSSGKGKTTCAYFIPGTDRIVWATTELASPDCPPRPDYSKGYVWVLHEGFDLVSAKRDGSDLKRLTSTPGYDAEATVSRDGKKIVFTSVRDGDLDIYTMNPDGSGVQRLTSELGYDGGPFFSADGKKIVYRAHHPEGEQEIASYRSLLAQNMIRPMRFEIWVMDADGKNKRQVTKLGAASFAPFFHPDGKRIVFASNVHDKQGGRNFDVYLINLDGTGLERVTHGESFEGFPMFTSDGKRLVFASNRGGKERGETNIFIADWKD